MRWNGLGLVIISVTLFARRGGATDQFEIQVYEGDHNAPFQPSVELHSNYTVAGHKAPAYPGETAPDRALRFTLEPALGITDWLEIGAYLQTMASPSEGGQFSGWKLRAKFVVPARMKLPMTLGINIEVGRVPRHVEETGWANEFRPILAFDLGRLGLAFNPLVGYALTGPEAFKPDFEPAMKAKWNTQMGFALGFEHYTSLGRFDLGFAPLSKQEHLTFAAFDLEPACDGPPSPWELNIAVGTALTESTPQHWIVKTIIGRSF